VLALVLGYKLAMAKFAAATLQSLLIVARDITESRAAAISLYRPS
jgi:hypothetical protein